MLVTRITESSLTVLTPATHKARGLAHESPATRCTYVPNCVAKLRRRRVARRLRLSPRKRRDTRRSPLEPLVAPRLLYRGMRTATWSDR